jgi:hypothetical protein
VAVVRVHAHGGGPVQCRLPGGPQLSKDEATALVATDSLAEPTGYGLGRHGWVSVQIGRGDRTRWELVEEWVRTSYTLVAPKPLAKVCALGGRRSPLTSGRATARRRRFTDSDLDAYTAGRYLEARAPRGDGGYVMVHPDPDRLAEMVLFQRSADEERIAKDLRCRFDERTASVRAAPGPA